MNATARKLSPVFFIILLFVAARLWAWHSGLHFKDDALEVYWHFLDRSLLQHDLLRSLWFLHDQPPLLNLVTGLLLKIFGADWAIGFYALNLVLGLGTCLIMQSLVVGLTGRPWAGWIAGALFAVSPTLILYEAVAFYMVATAFLITAIAWAAWRILQNENTRYGIILMVLFALLLLLRASYHLALALLPLWLLWRCYGMGKMVRMAWPLLLPLGWYAKNLLLFGFFGASSWLGMNLATIALYSLPPEPRAILYDQTHDPLLLSDKPFEPYLRYGLPPVKTAGLHPALGEMFHASGEANFNYLGYLEVSRRYRALSLHSIRQYPGIYLSNVGDALTLYGNPGDRFFLLRDNLDSIRPYADGYDLLVLGSRAGSAGATDALSHGFSMVFGLALPLAAGILWVMFAREAENGTAQRRKWLAFTILLIGYSVAAHIGIEIGENNRFRFDIEPLMYVLVATALAKLLPILRRRFPAD